MAPAPTAKIRCRSGFSLADGGVVSGLPPMAQQFHLPSALGHLVQPAPPAPPSPPSATPSWHSRIDSSKPSFVCSSCRPHKLALHHSCSAKCLRALPTLVHGLCQLQPVSVQRLYPFALRHSTWRRPTDWSNRSRHRRPPPPLRLDDQVTGTSSLELLTISLCTAQSLRILPLASFFLVRLTVSCSCGSIDEHHHDQLAQIPLVCPREYWYSRRKK